MTVPLVLLAIPTVLLGLLIGPLLESFTNARIFHWLEPVFRQADEILGIHPHEYELFGIDGALILVSVAVAALGIGVGIWLFGFFRSRARPDVVERTTRRNRLTRGPVHGLGQQVVVRRPQPARLLPLRRRGRQRASCGSTCASSTASSTARAPSPRRPASGSAASRPGACRTTRWASPSGLVVIVGPLHVAGALMLEDFLGQLDLLSLLIFTPLVGAVVLAFVPGRHVRAHPRRGAWSSPALAFLALPAGGPLLRRQPARLPARAAGRLDRLLRHRVHRSAWTASRSCWCCSRRC